MIKPTKIIRSKRRSISLVINEQAQLIVRAPLKCDDQKIYDFINTKQRWILAKQNLMRQSADNNKKIEVTNGEQIEILDQMYTLNIGNHSRASVSGYEIKLPTTDSRTKLVKLLMRMAKDYFTLRVEHYASVMQVKYKDIKVNQAHTRWGSCSATGSLNFCFRLIFTSQEVLDYIVVHEMSHLVHKNHSASFWAYVQKFCPNYKEYERWLKTNRHIMLMI